MIEAEEEEGEVPPPLFFLHPPSEIDPAHGGAEEGVVTLILTYQIPAITA